MSLPGHSEPCRCSACRHEADNARKPLISFCNVSFERDDKYVLSDINFTVDSGDFIAITGPNGGGKTTLLRLLLGLLKPSSGKILFFDQEGNPAAQIPTFGYLPQKNSVDSHFPITVSEVIASGLITEKTLTKAEKDARIGYALDLIGMKDLADRSIGKLSGGQLQRALFGRAIVRKPEVLVLDEPLSYIDKNFEARLYDIISEMASYSTILLVSHEMSRISGMACRHVIVDHELTECTASHHFIPEY